jgi:hypothetical protein
VRFKNNEKEITTTVHHALNANLSEAGVGDFRLMVFLDSGKIVGNDSVSRRTEFCVRMPAVGPRQVVNFIRQVREKGDCFQ